jgi:hypothetical protein
MSFENSSDHISLESSSMKMALPRMTSGGLFLPRTIFFSLLIALALVCAGVAQDTDETETGSVTGTVTSTKGAPIAGVRILLTDRLTGKTSAVRTNAQGKYNSGDIAAADYTVRAEVRSFITATSSATVKAGAATTVDFVLAPEPLPGVVGAREIEVYPLRSLNFLELLQLEPGVQNQNAGTFAPNKNGYSSLSIFNQYGTDTPVEADGLSLTDRVSGGPVQNLPATSIQEFQFGGLLAPISNQLYVPGAVNIVTRSGEGQLHGSLFGSYGNGDILGASLPGGHSHHWGRQFYGGNAGGALTDKLFLYASAERGRQDLLNPVLPGGAFAVLNPAFTSVDEPYRSIVGSGRVDYKASDATRLFYRFAYDHNTVVAPFSSGPSLQPISAETNAPSHTVGFDTTSGSLVHSFRFEYLRYKNTTAPPPPGATHSIPAGFTPFDFNIGGGSISQCSSGALICVGSSPFVNQQNYQSNAQFRYDGSRISGKHQFHFGGSYDHIAVGRLAPLYSSAPVLSDQNPVPLPAAPGGPSGLATDPSSYPVQWAYLSNGLGFQSEKPGFGLPAGSLTDKQFSLYAGDTFKATQNVAVTYGVSWVRDTVPNNSDLQPIAALNLWQRNLGSRVRQPNYNFAPHLGVAWDTSSNGTTTLRAGIGMFYDQSSFLNAYSDRALRLQQGNYFATAPACVGGASGRIQWPTAATGSIPGGVINSDGTVSPFDSASGKSWCGESMGTAAPLAFALQQAYQLAFSGAASNSSFIGNPNAFASPMLNQLSLMDPNYQTPRSVQMNAGLRHELRPGLVFTIDYLRQVTTRSLLGIDVNEGGAANTFNLANALAARDVAQTQNGCSAGTNQVSCMVAKLGPIGALDAYGAAGIGGPAQVTAGAPCSYCAFPGLRPNLGVNVVDMPVGRSVYSGVLLSLNQEITNFSRGVRSASFRFSYSHSKNVSQGQDATHSLLANDYANPDRFTGPDALDRTHQVSIAANFDLEHSLQLSFLSHFASPLPVTLRFPQEAGGAEVLVTDWNGDGSTGDLVPNTTVGAYMRSSKPGNLPQLITQYNNITAGNSPQTPAGNALLNAGIFSLADLQSMGGVLQPLAAPVSHLAGLGWYKTFDVRLGWEHHLGERFTLTPSLSLYNLFNFANFDTPGYVQSGILNFGSGSLMPGATLVQPQNTVGGTSSFANGRTNRTSLQPNMNASGAPRSLEWGLKLSF